MTRGWWFICPVCKQIGDLRVCVKIKKRLNLFARISLRAQRKQQLRGEVQSFFYFSTQVGLLIDIQSAGFGIGCFMTVDLSVIPRVCKQIGSPYLYVKIKKDLTCLLDFVVILLRRNRSSRFSLFFILAYRYGLPIYLHTRGITVRSPVMKHPMPKPAL